MAQKTKIGTSYQEDQYGRNVDKCTTDFIVKGTTGFLLGALFSVLFTKRRSFPLWAGTGYGFGLAYKTCERRINDSRPQDA